MDQFNGTADNGNRNGTIANAVFNSSTGEFATMFANCYSRISSVNFFIREANAKRNSGTLSEKAVAMIDRYIGEAKFIRAYSYWYLFNHYCQPYSADIAQTGAMASRWCTSSHLQATPAHTLHAAPWPRHLTASTQTLPMPTTH